MTDSPLPRIPLDPKEQPILDKLQSIRTELELLKRDRSTYVKSQDVLKLYDQVIEQVIVLNEIRVTKRLEQNKGMVYRHRVRKSPMLTRISRNSRLHARRLLPTHLTCVSDSRKKSRATSCVCAFGLGIICADIFPRYSFVSTIKVNVDSYLYVNSQD